MKPELFIAFLVNLGVPTATIEKFKKEAEKDTVDPEFLKPFVSSFQATQRQLLENDADFIASIQGPEAAKKDAMTLRKLKSTFALSTEDMKDKTVEEVIALVKEKAAAANTNPDVKAMQEANVALQAKLDDIEANVIPEIRKEVDTHKAGVNIDFNLTKKLSAAKLRVPLDAAYPSLKAFLAQNYDLVLNDKGEVDYFVKGSQLKQKAADGSKLLTLDEIVNTQLDSWQFLQKSNGTEGGAGGKTIQPIKAGDEGGGNSQTNKVYAPHIEAAKLKLEQEKAAAAEGKEQ